MSAVADNVACYCEASRSCTLFYTHTQREVGDDYSAGTAVRVPWYSSPLVMNATQDGADGTLNRPHWPLHQFAKLLRLAEAWAMPGAPEWLWFIDADTRILNYSVPITSFLPRDDPSVGLVVVDHPWAGIVSGSFLVRRSEAGFGILRDMWEAQLHDPPLREQTALADALLTRTMPRTSAPRYSRFHCMTSPHWHKGGWQAMVQCWNWHMAHMGHPYGHRRTTGVSYVDPAGPDFQAFSYHAYGDRYARRPSNPGRLSAYSLTDRPFASSCAADRTSSSHVRTGPTRA